MTEYTFSTLEEFTEFFTSKERSFVDSIITSVREAIEKKKQSAHIFIITIEESGEAYDISLPRSQWVTSLEECLRQYTASDKVDESIDAWSLLNEVKNLEKEKKDRSQQRSKKLTNLN